MAKTTTVSTKPRTRKPAASAEPPVPLHDPPAPPRDPRAILDLALAEAAQTIADAARGVEISREQLAAAQDILNRKGVTGAARSNPVPESFARDAFATVFRLLGFEPIRWPSDLEPEKKGDPSTLDAFNAALVDS